MKYYKPLISYFPGHDLLRNPVAADLWVDEKTGLPLSPPPVPDPTKAAEVPAFASGLMLNGRDVVNVGVGGIFVDRNDYDAFIAYVTENMFEAEAEKAKEYKRKLAAYKIGQSKHSPLPHVPYRPTSQAVEFGISLIWPSQSFASINLFRGPTERRLADFHHQRFHALAG